MVRWLDVDHGAALELVSSRFVMFRPCTACISLSGCRIPANAQVHAFSGGFFYPAPRERLHAELVFHKTTTMVR